MLFKFIVGDAQMYNPSHRLNRLGQTIDVPQEVGERAAFDGAALLPADQFDAIFDASDVEKYPNGRRQADAPKEFKDKIHAALLKLHDYRETLKPPEPASEPAPTQELEPQPVTEKEPSNGL